MCPDKHSQMCRKVYKVTAAAAVIVSFQYIFMFLYKNLYLIYERYRSLCSIVFGRKQLEKLRFTMSSPSVHDDAKYTSTISTYIYIQVFVKTRILLYIRRRVYRWLCIHWLSHFSRTNFYVAEVNTNRPEIFRFLFQTRFVRENLSAAAQISDQKLCRSVTILCNRRRFYTIFIWRARLLPIPTLKYLVSTLYCSPLFVSNRMRRCACVSVCVREKVRDRACKELVVTLLKNHKTICILLSRCTTRVIFGRGAQSLRNYSWKL